jgi:hypothetical protein
VWHVCAFVDMPGWQTVGGWIISVNIGIFKLLNVSLILDFLLLICDMKAQKFCGCAVILCLAKFWGSHIDLRYGYEAWEILTL